MSGCLELHQNKNRKVIHNYANTTSNEICPFKIKQNNDSKVCQIEHKTCKQECLNKETID